MAKQKNIPFGGSNFRHLYSVLLQPTLLKVDVSAVSSLCCGPKNAESLLCFNITLHSRTSRQGLSIKHVGLHNLPPIAFIQISFWQPKKTDPFTYMVFSGFWFLLCFQPSEI